jgi:hypothetical protein
MPRKHVHAPGLGQRNRARHGHYEIAADESVGRWLAVTVADLARAV